MVALVLAKKSKPVKGKDKKQSKVTKETSEKPSKASTKVDKELLGKAVKALLKYHEAQNENKEQLLGTDTSIQVNFTLEVAPVQPTRKPYRIDIPHSIFKVSKDEENEELEEPEVCLIVKDGSKEGIKEMIDQFPDQMGFIKKVMTLESLRKKHSQYNQRRELLKKYSVFMADDRILPMLTKCLGKDFLKAKKHPIPVELTRKAALPINIFKSLSATFLHLSEGTCVSVRAGYTHMTADHLVENIMTILDKGGEKIPRRWANIRALSVKTPTSMSLPFYNKTPAELAEIARLAGVEQVWQNTAKTNNDGNDEDMTDKGDSPKKRKEIKSPLVQALKKQKKMDTETKEGESKNVGQDSASTKKQKKHGKHADDAEKSTKKPKHEKTEKAGEDTGKSSKKTSDEPDENVVTPAKKADKEATTKSSKKKQKKPANESTEAKDEKEDITEETLNAKPSKSKKEKVDAKDTPKEEEEKSSSKKKKRKSNAGDEEESPKKAKAAEGGGDFIASNSFTGSKKGYVFRKGPKGLGYYVDIKPVPDKAALAALARMAEHGKGRNERRKSSGSTGKKGGKKSKGRRSF